MQRPVSLLWSPSPSTRLATATSLGPRQQRRALAKAQGWPAHSAGSINAWLLLLSSKPATWDSELSTWRDQPPTLGRPHQNFFYPDPLSFWAEVRRWSTQLLSRVLHPCPTSAALSLTALVHVGDEAERVAWARRALQPGIVLFLDEAACALASTSGEAGAHVPYRSTYAIADPWRPGQRYEGSWAVEADGTVVGKAPQHPAANRFYRARDLAGFLAAAPLPATASWPGPGPSLQSHTSNRKSSSRAHRLLGDLGPSRSLVVPRPPDPSLNPCP